MGITRERGPVGRGKVFRRRRKKRAASMPDAEPSAPPSSDGYVFDDVRREAYAPKVQRGGMWSMVRRLFSGRRDERGKDGRKKLPPRESESAVMAPGDDPVRRILALPKGPARLDAFAETLLQLTAGSHGQRAVALAFYKELVTMAEKAQIDLSLLPERVEACAEALVAAGEGEKAGQLLAKIGRRQRAAELFVAAGAIDDLEEMHLHIDLEGGGKKQQAKLCYERFEAFFLVGRRGEALDALHEAVKLWPDNPVYLEIQKTFESRVMNRRATFVAGAATVDVEARWPVVVGRGEDASVRLKSPLVSRAHVSISAEGDRLVAYDLDDRRAAKVDDELMLAGHALVDGGTIEMVGVAVRYEATKDALMLWADLQPAHRTLVVRAADVVVPAPSSRAPAFRMRFDAHGRAEALPTPGVTVGDEALDRPVLLLVGDKIAGPGFLWHAAGA